MKMYQTRGTAKEVTKPYMSNRIKISILTILGFIFLGIKLSILII